MGCPRRAQRGGKHNCCLATQVEGPSRSGPPCLQDSVESFGIYWGKMMSRTWQDRRIHTREKVTHVAMTLKGRVLHRGTLATAMRYRENMIRNEMHRPDDVRIVDMSGQFQSGASLLGGGTAKSLGILNRSPMRWLALRATRAT
jgi:hypothetical protein